MEKVYKATAVVAMVACMLIVLSLAVIVVYATAHLVITGKKL